MEKLLRVGFCNVNSAKGKIYPTKELMKRENFDVFALLETKLDSSVDDYYLHIPDYVTNRFDGERGCSGIVIYTKYRTVNVKNVIAPKIYRGLHAYVQIAAMDISIGGEELIIVVVYISRDTGYDESIDYVKQFCEEHFSDRKKQLVLMGDFNAHVESTDNLKPLIQWLSGMQTVRELTRERAILDCVIIADPKRHVATRVLEKIGSSDHKAIATDIRLIGSKQEDAELDEDQPPTSPLRVPKAHLCTFPGCKRGFKSASHLKQHVAAAHSVKPAFKCDKCGKTFWHQGHLSRHLLIHEEEDPYSCDVCGKRFNQKGNLEIHKRSHSGERPFKCCMCDEAFSDPRNLKRHERTHSGEKPYACKHCQKRFHNSSDMKQHEKMHTDERPFPCATCGKAFRTNGHLKIHQVIHTGATPYECPTCGKEFNTMANMRRHEKRIHK